MVEHVVIRELAQACAMQCRIKHRLAAVAAPVAMNPLRKLLALLLEQPCVGAADQAVVLAQL
jgi:hypothetical protein